ncbi:MAG: M14/M99 family metallopeptidase [Desulfobacterota bacterium]|nr:M14/M99 family metallopeptidase [Thermodesulfobacteriota bacterium]
MSLRFPALRKGFLSLVCTMVLTWGLFPSQAFSKREHQVYFPNTAYELNIYKIKGKKPGKTLMLIGGIQGNEPGGFLSADLYADMRLEKGNLIVVPRANFYSIITNQRGPNGDLNRKFNLEDNSSTMEDQIVSILKKLISESDYLLNLHDGAGYYHPTYMDKWRNPTLFGQSIVADCEEYRLPGAGKTLKLGEMARKILKEVNPHINVDLYKFHFMDTRTDAEDSPHREQRGSATYYALTKHNIPAFGVETSKFLPSIDLKVLYHNMVINAFMKHFGIIPESPGLNLDPPVLKYLVVAINAQTPIVVEGKQTLELRAGDTISVTHIEANYERGLSLDIVGYGGVNDLGKDYAIFRDTSILVRKDNQQVAEIPIRITEKGAGEETRTSAPIKKIDYLVIEAKGHRLLLANGETLPLVRGEEIKIVDVLPRAPSSSGVKVNFKGFVGDQSNNTGEDRGYPINTGTDLMERFSLDGKGDSYEIVVNQGEALLGRVVVRLNSPKVDFLVLRVNGHGLHVLKPKSALSVSREDTICVEEVRTNLSSSDGLSLKINGQTVLPGEVKTVKELYPAAKASDTQLKVEKGPLVLGMITLNVR